MPRSMESLVRIAFVIWQTLTEQVTPINRQKSADSKARAEEVQKQIASLSVRLHASLVRAGLNRPR